MLYFTYKGVEFMTITMYINNNETLKKMDFLTAYTTIIELMKDKRLVWDFEKNEKKENV